MSNKWRSIVEPLMEGANVALKAKHRILDNKIKVRYYPNMLVKSYKKKIYYYNEIVTYPMTRSIVGKFSIIETNKGRVSIYYHWYGDLAYVNGYKCEAYTSQDFNIYFLIPVTYAKYRLLFITTSDLKEIVKWGQDDIVECIMGDMQMDFTKIKICDKACVNCVRDIQALTDLGYKFMTKREIKALYNGDVQPKAYKQPLDRPDLVKHFRGNNDTAMESFFYSEIDDVFLFPYLYGKWAIANGKVYIRTKDKKLVVATKDFVLRSDGTITVTDMYGKALDFKIEGDKVIITSHISYTITLDLEVNTVISLRN